MDISIILKYFPGLSPDQIRQFEMLGSLYPGWNEKINVISRKDIGNLYCNHILHSLAIARFLESLADNTTIVDLGTGGGFPGIPLAIFYPQCQFHLIDRIGKKIKVAQAIAQEIRLDNVTFQHGDMGECHRKFNYVVSRAVMPLPDLVKITKSNILPAASSKSNILPAASSKSKSIESIIPCSSPRAGNSEPSILPSHLRIENKYRNGLVCLKGGDLREEIEATKIPAIDIPLTDFFNEPFFATKSLIYVPY